MKSIYLMAVIAIAITIVASGCRASSGQFDINSHIKKTYWNCDEPVFCNNLVMVNCGADVDGPLYYLDKDTGNEISSCGGACFTANLTKRELCMTMCPPKEWTC